MITLKSYKNEPLGQFADEDAASAVALTISRSTGTLVNGRWVYIPEIIEVSEG